MKLFKATLSFLTFLLVLTATTNVAFAKSSGDKIKDTISEGAAALKRGVDQLGDDLNSIQNYLDNYQWKGMIQGKATSGVITLSDLRINEHHRVAAVRPGAIINADVACYTDPDKASSFGVYRAVIGFKGVGPQTTISSLGFTAGNKLEKFSLRAPSQPGVYEIRFRTVGALLEGQAFNEWLDAQGNEPDATTTIGVVIVKE